MPTLEEMQEARELFVNVRSAQGFFMISGDASDELAEWTMLLYNFMAVGFDHNECVTYLEYGIKPDRWIS